MARQQYGFWCYSYEEWGIVHYEIRDGHASNQEEGPFNTFREAKSALLEVLLRRSYDYKKGATDVRRLKKSDVV